MDLDDLLYRRVYTGKAGRPVNSGRRDFENMYEICQRMAADPRLSRTAAIRQVVDTVKDYNAVDRLTRKLRRAPRMLGIARGYRASAIDRFLRSARGAQSELQLLGFRSQQAVANYLLIKAAAPPEIWDDTQVKAAIDEAWCAVRPGTALVALWQVQDMMASLEPYRSARYLKHQRFGIERHLGY